ncbi:MAG: 3-phosphoshikimate 1-carboxyvinyltransferase [Ruminococcaceae bacterium]|nr:3-phosphoshikimate 1-carboxyvinyltransferase [Oscillospiraceae bacterium]
MNITVKPSTPMGKIEAISSKSVAHRILICAAFADRDTVVRCDRTNKDIEATAACLCALGASILYEAPLFYVTPIKTPVDGAILPCNESGSTLRFLLPLVPALGIKASFDMRGRLPERPLSPLYEELVAHGASLSAQGSNPLVCTGALTGKEYRIRGDVSSQFISGLLFALTFSGKGGRLIIEGETQSAPYIDMTVDALSLFGAAPEKTEYGYIIRENAKLCSPSKLVVEGDWSNAAFPLCMGAVGKGEVSVVGLSARSHQGDRAIVDILRRFGADVTESNGVLTVKGGKALCGIEIDASQIPDMVPALATVASVADGTTTIYGAARLRIKESDRLMSVSAMLNALGADVTETDDGLIIKGKKALSGGAVDCFNDHRIAMSACVASAAATEDIVIRGAECASKSYPDFWTDVRQHLGVQLNVES